MRAYLYDNLDTDCREPHELNPSVPVSVDELKETGVLYWQLDLEPEKFRKQVDDICIERNYKNRDEITVSKAGLGDLFDQKIKTFFTEHLHEDEEIRAILDGSGYFDVRDKQDRWIRIEVEAGDLIVLPAGIYHRFTLDLNNYLKAMRLFKEDPVWTPLNRPCDDNPHRKAYLETLVAH
ncbi:1,2-dihydroxy-3-keto-5-methylthiopentene dioxygenase [Mortierella sp. NVP85]|nr:1,2-dihydroxy-3-keto-5-methylthiopentene dioxygenase [Mortierella sp. NVP85]